MKRSRRTVLLLLLAAISITIGVVLLKGHCPPQGIAFTQERRDFHRLKNRATLPQLIDFDPRATLASMLQPGDDRARWSNSRAAKLEGYVVAIAKANVELANCYLPCNRDTHINLALHPDAPSREQVVMEITPRMEDWARRQGWDWSDEALKRELLGRWCSFEGWLFFDATHAEESENIAPGRKDNWRATAWEIHPITRFEVIK